MDKYTVAETLSTADQLKAFHEIGTQLFGKSFRLLPRFDAGNPTAFADAKSWTEDPHGLLSEGGDFPVQEWVQGIAKVRPRMQALQFAHMMENALVETDRTLTPLQFPASFDEMGNRNDPWLGISFPESFTPQANPLSIVMDLYDGFDPAQPICGLLLDEWAEKLPAAESNAAIALHYDQPGTEAPQSVLVAVTPKETGQWEWEDLVDTLSETLDRAKKRAVDQDLLSETAYAHILPSMVATLNGDESLPHLDFGRNMAQKILGILNGEVRFESTDLSDFTLNRL